MYVLLLSRKILLANDTPDEVNGCCQWRLVTISWNDSSYKEPIRTLLKRLCLREASGVPGAIHFNGRAFSRSFNKGSESVAKKS